MRKPPTTGTVQLWELQELAHASIAFHCVIVLICGLRSCIGCAASEPAFDAHRKDFTHLDAAGGLEALRWHARNGKMEVLIGRVSRNSSGKNGAWTHLMAGTEFSAAPAFDDEDSEYWSPLRAMAAGVAEVYVVLYHTHPSSWMRRLVAGKLMPNEQKEADFFGFERTTFSPGRRFGTPPSPNDIRALQTFVQLMRDFEGKLNVKITAMEAVIDETGEWRYQPCVNGACPEQFIGDYVQESQKVSIRTLQVKWAKFINSTQLRGSRLLAAPELKDIVYWYAMHGIRLTYQPFD